MKKSLLFLIALLMIAAVGMPVGLVAMQDSTAPSIEITGVNPSQLPEVTVTANVYNALGQPVRGLTAADFAVEGELAGQVSIVSVENVTDNDLSFAVVLLIDTSDSMTGTPLIRAQEAARAFVENIGPNDPVAIMSFDRDVEILQNYTTDKAALLAAINSLQTGGPTSLYQGAFDAIRLAQASPTPRRVVVLLSDGAEFGGWSRVERGAALDEARARGVSVVTIGLGYGTDRTYLQELSQGTNSRNVESPTPEELVGIYTDLAALLRSQYVITLDAPLPADGTEYDLTLRVDTPDGSASASGTLRTPIPVPIVRFNNMPAGPIDEPTDIEVTILADDEIASTSSGIEGAALAGGGSAGGGGANEEPETPVSETVAITVNPVDFPPGPYTLSASATDVDGDTGTASVEIEIAALPSTIEIIPDLSDLGAVDEPQTLTLGITGQTPPVSASFQMDDEPALSIDAQPFIYEFDPFLLTPGEHTLTVEVVNEGGATGTLEQPFEVAAVPPVVTVRGLEDGQSIADSVQISVEALGQTPIQNIAVEINNVELLNAPQTSANASTAFTLNPIDLRPGATTLTVNVTDASGETTSVSRNFLVTTLPPVLDIEGLTLGQTLDENTTINVEPTSQTAISLVTYSVDGVEVIRLTRRPFSLPLDILDLGPGTHIVTVTVLTNNGQTTTEEIAFTVPEGPSLTATALAPTPTPNMTETQAALNAAATAAQDRANVVATATQGAVSTANAQATINAEQIATGTAIIQSTFDAAATASEVFIATVNAQSTADAQAAVQATQQREGTLEFVQAQQSALELEATALSEAQSATAQAEANVRATHSANLQATTAAGAATVAAAATNQEIAQQQATDIAATADSATATAQREGTATFLQGQQATLEGAATAQAEVQAAANATSTAQSEATASFLEAQAVEASETFEAQASRTAQLQSVQRTEQAQTTATESAHLVETVIAQAAMDAQATSDRQATIDAQATATRDAVEAASIAQASTATANVRATEIAQSTLEAAATSAADARASATANAQSTLDADNTQAAEEAAEARNETATAQAEAQDATATANAEGTDAAAAAATSTADAEGTEAAGGTSTAAVEGTTAAGLAASEAAQEATEAVTEQATEQATEEATETEEATFVAQAATEIETEETPTVERTQVDTPTPITTLIPAQSEPNASSSDIMPILIVIIVGVVILLVIFLVLRGGRQRRL